MIDDQRLATMASGAAELREQVVGLATMLETPGGRKVLRRPETAALLVAMLHQVAEVADNTAALAGLLRVMLASAGSPADKGALN